MAWLTEWDDLIHGTAVFGAAMPLGLALAIGWWLPARLWIAVAAALGVSVFCIFGWPSWPLNGSEDIVATGLVVAISLIVQEMWLKGARSPWEVGRPFAWFVVAFVFYPAGLAAGQGRVVSWLVALAMGISIATWAAIARFFAREGRGGDSDIPSVTPATWVPPSIALAVLLGLGGATRFAQCAGALAAATGGVCLLLVLGRGRGGLRLLARLWGMLFAFLAWAGWLFAEIQVIPALALLLTPIAALAARRLPLPRRSEFHEQFWDFLAAFFLAALVITAAWLKYSASSDSSGY